MVAAQYIPLSVRVKTWSLSLFSRDELIRLLDQEQNYVLARIVQKENLPSTYANVGEVLRALRQKLVFYGRTAAGTLSGEGRTFVREIMREFEIENLKNLVRMIVSGRFEDIFYNHVFTPELSLQRYREIRSFSELRRWLEGTYYRGILNALDKVEAEKNTVFWESALDTLYANRIFIVSKRLDTKGKMGAKKLILFPLHMDRLLQVYRFRFHYQMDAGDTYIQIPNATHVCSIDLWKSFVSSPSSVNFYNLMKEKKYIDESSIDDASNIYLGVWRRVSALCRRELYGSLTSISSFLAFYQLKKMQINRLSTILEAKSLSIGKEDALRYL